MNLLARFKMKDMGRLHYCLGVNIEQDESNKCLWIHQKQYILKLIDKYGLLLITVPNSIRVKKPINQTEYQSLVRSLLYATIATRPDIAQTVGVVSKYNSNPSQLHLTAAKRILRYLKGTTELAIKYQKLDNESLIGYSDADWAGDQDDRHSTTGNLFIMAGGPISWLSKKQPIVALSTSEAEYIALSSASQEAVWLRRLLTTTLRVSSNKPVTIMEDNQGAIAMSKNPIAHSRTKHIDIRYHYIREAIQEGLIKVHYCPTNKMLVDILTKPLLKGRFQELRQAMGMIQLMEYIQQDI